ncbi:hypothetical protein CBM2623_A60138 [Cupriavidus taiwanensis]|nr:hypothetical protein CBM2608_A50175 [Cupriavidus taiwanensis]SPA29876.1 hypothetical protein CBM2623_A60138 [Cupriavidus taiwanensis]
MGQFPADLFDGGPDQWRHAAVGAVGYGDLSGEAAAAPAHGRQCRHPGQGTEEKHLCQDL